MKEQLTNKILSSFCLYFDNLLLTKGQAFKTRTGAPLYYLKDSRLPSSLKTFSSERKQWVYDSSVPGAVIASGVSGASGFSAFSNAIIPDFTNGRIISTSLVSGGAYSCSYSHKDVNVYITDEREEQLIFDTAGLSIQTSKIANSGIAPYTYALPAAFCFINGSNPETLQLGDDENKHNKITIRVVTIMDSTFVHDAVHSISHSAKDKCFCLLPSDKTPLDEFGNIKSQFSGQYNYQNIVNENSDDWVYIEKVRTSKLSYGSHETLQKDMKFGFVDFFVNYVGPA